VIVRHQVAVIIRDYEGGLSDHASDRGGLTNYGITLQTLQDERPGSTREDLIRLTREDAIDLMTERYALKPGYARITDPRLRFAVIDYAIHSGPRRATCALQKVAGVTVDGIFGRDTESAVNYADTRTLLLKFLGQRLRFLGRLVTNDPRQAAFAAGWLNRVATQIEAA
jgi:lysozyme family protein